MAKKPTQDMIEDTLNSKKKSTPLTPKEQALVELVFKGYSPTNAWVEAGYTNAPRNVYKTLQKPKLQQYMSELKEQAKSHAICEKQDALRNLTDRLHNATDANAVKIVQCLAQLLGWNEPEKSESSIKIEWESLADKCKEIIGKDETPSRLSFKDVKNEIQSKINKK